MYPEFLERRIIRLPLFAALIALMFALSLSLTFPGERVKQILIVQAEKALQHKYEVTIADLGVWRLSGIELSGLTIKERWSAEQKAEADREAKEGAPPRVPFSVTIPRVGVRVAPLASILNLGLGAAFTIDFEDGGSVDGVFVQRVDGQRVLVELNELDMMRAGLIRSVTGIPAFGELSGEASFDIAGGKKPKIEAGRLRFKGSKLTLGPGLVKKDTLPSAVAASIPAALYLDIPSSSFGNMVFEADVVVNKAGEPELHILKASTQGRDVRGELWGKLMLPVGSAPMRAELSMRMQFDESYVRRNNLGMLLNIEQFRKGKSSDNWFGFEFKGPLSRLNATTLRGSIVAAQGPPAAGAAKPSSASEEAEATKKAATKPAMKEQAPEDRPEEGQAP
jgi:type II secretion system protein N